MSDETVTADLGAEMLVKVITTKAIGLCKPGEDDVSIWIPKSHLVSAVPDKGEHVQFIDITEWMAKQKKLKYEGMIP